MALLASRLSRDGSDTHEDKDGDERRDASLETTDTDDKNENVDDTAPVIAPVGAATPVDPRDIINLAYAHLSLACPWAVSREFDIKEWAPEMGTYMCWAIQTSSLMLIFLFLF